MVYQTTGKNMKYKLLVLSIASSLSMGVNATQVFNMEGFGAVSRSLGGAGVAHNIGAAGMMYNPATLALMKEGSEFYLGLDVITTDINTKNLDSNENASSNHHGNNRGPYFAPQIAYTYKNGALTYGVGVFAQGGLGTEFGSSSFLSRTTVNSIDTGLENSSRLLNLRVPLAIAYQVNDKLTVGATVEAIWSSLNLELLLDVTQVGSLAADGRVDGTLVPTLLGVPELSGAHFSFTKDEFVGGGVDAVGFGAKLGLTYQLTQNTTFGLSYNFKSSIPDLKGTATLTAVSNLAGNIPLTGDIKLRDFQNPAQLSLGVSHKVNDKLSLLFDVQRVFWKDALENLDVGFVHDESQANINILLPQNYDDINVYAFGAEYIYNNNWTLRAGYSHTDQAVPSDSTFAIVPAYITDHLTAGFTYTVNQSHKVDFAISHAFEETRTNSSQPNTSVPIETSHSQTNLVISYSYAF